MEFKSCNELKAGIVFRDKDGSEKPRQPEQVIQELTKDVTAFLNSAGGTIIYGVIEKKSRAERVDISNAYKGAVSSDDIRPEKIVQWLRSYISPVPSVNVYSILAVPTATNSPWYIVIEIPQGQTAYMAKDHKFYKRVSNNALPMEQYEVVDVMNRTRSAVLDLTLTVSQDEHSNKPNYTRIKLAASITNNSFMASEYGALKIVLAKPCEYDREITPFTFQGAYFDYATEMYLDGLSDVPHAQSMRFGWGANAGIVIFPGETFSFHKHSIFMYVPSVSIIPNPIYLLQTEIFTMNNTSRRMLYSIGRQTNGDKFEITLIDGSNYDTRITAFWETYNLYLVKTQNI